jgi:hypothetical protein
MFYRNSFCAYDVFILPMENPFEELSAAKLRILLIEEVREFVQMLDTANWQELKRMRGRLSSMYHLLSEKEKIESAPIVWGKSSTGSNVLTETRSDILPE